MPETTLTVIICTYNRARIIGDCLDSLCAQGLSPLQDLPILVVNNNSTDNTRQLVQSYVERLPGLRMVDEAAQGLSHARNRALKEAQTPWLAFLDDDARAYPDWVETILAVIAGGDFDAFGGPYYAWHRFGPPPAWFAPEWGAYAPLQAYGPLCAPAYISGGNCVVKKAAALAVGAFPVTLGMHGEKRIAYGEETRLFESMKRAGYRLGFVPEMRIDHCVMPHKYTLRWRLASSYAGGRDAPAAFMEQMTLRGMYRAWRQFFADSLLRAPRRAIHSLRARHPWQRIFLDVFSPCAYNLGRAVCFSRNIL
ncbi:succinoglycan biosynthesis protein ExoM [Deltaproteobacteria bacterium]|nr:succinoglycan biosynthesis protein ExoM [Deltaproteobacteria bacterium]